MADKQSKHPPLAVADDRDWQERFWTVQRIGWLMMALLVVAALAGATGKGGPLASATITTDGGIIDYPRISRWQSSEDVIVRLAPSASGDVELLVSPAFSKVFSIDSILPEPSSSQATAAGHLFTFATMAGGNKQIILRVTGGKPVVEQPVDVRIGRSAAHLKVTVLP